jgi:hypothetical protein
MQIDYPLSTNQNLIITLLHKAKPNFQFDVSFNDTGIPELVMKYGIVSDIPDDMDPEFIVKEPYKFSIPLDETATWHSVKKMTDLFEKYLRNVNLNKKR